MRIRILIACLVLAILAIASGRSFAQEAQPAPAPAMGPTVLWLFDLGVGQGYDDSPLGTGQGGYYTQFNPVFDIRQDREHGFWSINLQPMVQRFYTFSVADRVNESASTLDSWQITRRWRFDLTGNYLHTSDPFAQTQDGAQAQPIGNPVVVSPNNTFVGPESPFTVFGGSGTLSYQVRRYTELTFGGDYFSNRQTTAGLPNTSSEAFRAGYARMVRRGQTIGLNYSAQFLSVTNPGESITTNTLLLSYNFEWKAGRQIALFAGPQYSSIGATLSAFGGPSPVLIGLRQQVLSYSAGATLSLLLTKQNFFQLMASRRAVDGAGVSGAEIQDEGQLSVSRKFTKRVSASVGGFYSQNQALGNLPLAMPNTWGTFNRAEFKFAPRSSFSAEYDYFHQAAVSSALAPLFSHNRIVLEYHYSFGSLGEQR